MNVCMCAYLCTCSTPSPLPARDVERGGASPGALVQLDCGSAQEQLDGRYIAGLSRRVQWRGLIGGEDERVRGGGGRGEEGEEEQ